MKLTYLKYEVHINAWSLEEAFNCSDVVAIDSVEQWIIISSIHLSNRMDNWIIVALKNDVYCARVRFSVEQEKKKLDFNQLKDLKR